VCTVLWVQSGGRAGFPRAGVRQLAAADEDGRQQHVRVFAEVVVKTPAASRGFDDRDARQRRPTLSTEWRPARSAEKTRMSSFTA